MYSCQSDWLYIVLRFLHVGTSPLTLKSCNIYAYALHVRPQARRDFYHFISALTRVTVHMVSSERQSDCAVFVPVMRKIGLLRIFYNPDPHGTISVYSFVYLLQFEILQISNLRIAFLFTFFNTSEYFSWMFWKNQHFVGNFLHSFFYIVSKVIHSAIENYFEIFKIDNVKHPLLYKPHANIVHQYEFLMEQHEIRQAYEVPLPRNIVQRFLILINNQLRDATHIIWSLYDNNKE